ncbi:hypothetical protein Tco_0911886 [Tanacetum coccineum]
MGIQNFLCLPEWIGDEVQEKTYLDIRPTLQSFPFYCTPHAMADAVILNPTPEDLAASTSGATSSHVAKCTRSTLIQSFGSTTRPSLFVGDSDNESESDGDDDACVEILLVTPLRSAAVISSSGNQGRSSTAPAAEGPNTRDSRGKGIMADDAAALSIVMSRLRPSSDPVPSFRDVSGDEFTREEWDASYRPTFGVLNKEVIKDPTVCKIIPRDLHPRLLSKDFVTSELPDDAIGIYHRMFDFYGVRIPFSLFLLALIKHYRVHFSQLGLLGLNKVITFERRAPSPVCIDDNRSCMKHWKSGFFLIDQRAILDAMVWRHLNAAIDNPRPAAGSFNMVDVRRLSAHVIKLRDMLEGVLVLSELSRIWNSRVCDPVLRGAYGNGMGGGF